MPLMEKGVQMLSNRMPKVISPKVHAIIDFAVAGSFIVAGVMAWKNGHKKAAVSSFVTAGAELGVSLVTDYPGGIWPLISFPMHGKIDTGFVGLIGSMPNLMGFSEESASWFFRSQAMSMAAVTGLTDFGEGGRETVRHRRAA